MILLPAHYLITQLILNHRVSAVSNILILEPNDWIQIKDFLIYLQFQLIIIGLGFCSSQKHRHELRRGPHLFKELKDDKNRIALQLSHKVRLLPSLQMHNWCINHSLFVAHVWLKSLFYWQSSLGHCPLLHWPSTLPQTVLCKSRMSE